MGATAMELAGDAREGLRSGAAARGSLPPGAAVLSRGSGGMGVVVMVAMMLVMGGGEGRGSHQQREGKEDRLLHGFDGDRNRARRAWKSEEKSEQGHLKEPETGD